MHSADVLADSIRFEKSFWFKWGMLISLLGIVALLFSSFFIKVSNYVDFDVSIYKEKNQKLVTAKAGGRIHLLIDENQSCIKGEALAYIENITSYEDILEVKELLDNSKNEQVFSDLLESKSFLKSGDQRFQNSFVQLKQKLLELRNLNLYIKNVDVRIEYLHRQVALLNEMGSAFENQFDVQKQILNIRKEKYEIDSILFGQKVISSADLASSFENMLIIKNQFHGSKNNLLNNEIQLLNSLEKIEEQKYDLTLKKLNVSTEIKGSVQNILGLVNEWEDRYLLKSSSNGKVVFSDVLVNNEIINEGQILFFINEETNGYIHFDSINYIAIGEVDKSQVHKFTDDTNIRIEMSGYKVEDDGYLIGEMKKFYLNSTSNNIKIIVALNENLITTEDVDIKYVPGIKGKAFAKIKSEPLITKIFENYFKKLK